MHDQTRVDKWIARALAHTGMPLDRRAETAEEWRSHLNHLIDDNRDAGMTDEQAVRAALGAFGAPEILRLQLRREQRGLDRRAAMAEVRKGAPLFVVVPTVLVVLLSLAVRPASLWAAVIGGLCFIVSIAAVGALCAYFGGLFTLRIMRSRPRTEFAFLPRWGHWTAVSLVAITAAVWFPLLMVASLYPIVADLPVFQPGLMSFCKVYGIAMFEDHGLLRTYLAPVSPFVVALALTLYERSRCTDAADGSMVPSAL